MVTSTLGTLGVLPDCQKLTYMPLCGRITCSTRTGFAFCVRRLRELCPRMRAAPSFVPLPFPCPNGRCGSKASHHRGAFWGGTLSHAQALLTRLQRPQPCSGRASHLLLSSANNFLSWAFSSTSLATPSLMLFSSWVSAPCAWGAGIAPCHRCGTAVSCPRGGHDNHATKHTNKPPPII
jgi:hypothetical protein